MHVYKVHSKCACVKCLKVPIQCLKSIPNRVASWDLNQVNERGLLKRAEGWLFNLRRDGLRGYLKV